MAPILIILLIAVIAVGGYLLYQKQTKIAPAIVPQSVAQPTAVPTISPSVFDSADIASWKTYENKRYMYSIKYPPNIRIQSSAQATAADVAPAVELILSAGSSPYKGLKVKIIDPVIYAFINDVKPAFSNLSLDEFVQKLWQINNDSKNPYITSKVGNLNPTIIGGQKAYQFTLEGGYKHNDGGGSILDGGKNLFVFTERNNKIYIINYPTNERIFNQILSTFKFAQ